MTVTNADRVMFPDDGITKGEVYAYYTEVAQRMLPYLSGRALTVERYPKGIAEKGFMQKNAPAHYPPDLMDRYEVPKEEGGTTVYPVIHSEEAILFFANLGVITFHVPPVRVEDEAHPDWVVWDLDPPPGRFDLVREAARRMRALLEGLDIRTMPLASGSKGYHLRARVAPGITIDRLSDTVRGTAELAAARHDDLMTVAFRKSERGERVFVDWMRNTPRSTAVAPWSLRPRPTAPVASPLTWDELDDVAPDGVTLRNVDARLAQSPWASLEPVDLEPAATRVAQALDEAGIELEPFDRFRS
ncbi:MAG: ATP-dependent DNA ligase [Acidimicrobiia bacterium]